MKYLVLLFILVATPFAQYLPEPEVVEIVDPDYYLTHRDEIPDSKVKRQQAAFKSARVRTFIGYIMAPVGYGLMVVGATSGTTDEYGHSEPNDEVMVLGAVMFVGGTIFGTASLISTIIRGVKARRYENEWIYNQRVMIRQMSVSPTYNPKTQSSGLAFNFNF